MNRNRRSWIKNTRKNLKVRKRNSNSNSRKPRIFKLSLKTSCNCRWQRFLASKRLRPLISAIYRQRRKHLAWLKLKMMPIQKSWMIKKPIKTKKVRFKKSVMRHYWKRKFKKHLKNSKISRILTNRIDWICFIKYSTSLSKTTTMFKIKTKSMPNFSKYCTNL